MFQSGGGGWIRCNDYRKSNATENVVCLLSNTMLTVNVLTLILLAVDIPEWFDAESGCCETIILLPLDPFCQAR